MQVAPSRFFFMLFWKKISEENGLQLEQSVSEATHDLGDFFAPYEGTSLEMDRRVRASVSNRTLSQATATKNCGEAKNLFPQCLKFSTVRTDV